MPHNVNGPAEAGPFNSWLALLGLSARAFRARRRVRHVGQHLGIVWQRPAAVALGELRLVAAALALLRPDTDRRALLAALRSDDVDRDLGVLLLAVLGRLRLAAVDLDGRSRLQVRLQHLVGERILDVALDRPA